MLNLPYREGIFGPHSHHRAWVCGGIYPDPEIGYQPGDCGLAQAWFEHSLRLSSQMRQGHYRAYAMLRSGYGSPVIWRSMIMLIPPAGQMHLPYWVRMVGGRAHGL